jgi:hypothetical protein
MEGISLTPLLLVLAALFLFLFFNGKAASDAGQLISTRQMRNEAAPSRWCCPDSCWMNLFGFALSANSLLNINQFYGRNFGRRTAKTRRYSSHPANWPTKEGEVMKRAAERRDQLQQFLHQHARSGN